MDKKQKFNKITAITLFSLFIIGITSIILIRELPAFDYWWHFKSGEFMVQNKSIPFTDVFSWYGIENNLYWHSHEWLSAVFIYLSSVLFGKAGGYVFCVITSLLLVLILFLCNIENYFKNIKTAIVWVVLGVVILMPVITARPHMISFILLALTMYLLTDIRKNENSKKIWLLPIISILWVNFHGGSSNLPYVLTFLILLTGLFDFKIGRLTGTKLSKKQQLTLLTVGILSILALVINPHGIDMITYPYANMGDDFMLNIISEWRSPDLKKTSDIFIFIELFIIALPLLLCKDDLDLTDMGLIGGMVFLTFKSVRFSVLLYIVATFVIFKYIPKLKDELAIKQFSIIFGLLGLLFIGFFAIEVPSIVEKPMKVIVSDKIIETIKKENPQRLYNDYDLGGYLIYNDIKVFVDGRADMYSGHNLKDAVDLSAMNVGVEKIIEKYKFDMFVIYEDTPLNYYLKNNNNYTKLIEDDGVVIYKPIKKEL